MVSAMLTPAPYPLRAHRSTCKAARVRACIVIPALDAEATIASYDSSFEPPAGAGRMAIALRAGSPAEVDQVYARMTAAGHRSHLEPWDAFWGQRYTSLIDPNDVQVDIYCPLG